MTAPAQPKRRLLPWFLFVVVPACVGASAAYFLQQSKPHDTPVAAYLLPVDNDSRVKLSWWPAKQLAQPLALHSAEQATLPQGAKIKLVHADTGAVEDIAGPTKISLQQKLPSETETLLSPLTEVVSTAKSAAPRQTPGVVFTSPVGKTRYLNPQIAWLAAEGKFYDVAVLDPSDPDIPPRVASNVRPPVVLADLETPQRRQLGRDRNYEIIIRETGAPTIAGGARFLTTPDAQLDNKLPATPADQLAEAFAAMAKKPYRTGDAWLALQELPDDWTKSEPVIRLRLRIAAELGLAVDFSHALEDAARLR